MSIEDQIIELLESPIDTPSRLEKVLQLCNENKSDLLRDNPRIHLSASAVVPFYGKRCFFVGHPYLRKLLLPAGHVEPGEEPFEAAQREFHEETGYFAKNYAELLDIRLIKIPENPVKNEAAHQHIQFCFRLNLVEKSPIAAELPVCLLTREEAPEEFKAYYDRI